MSYRQRVHRTVVHEQQRRIRALGARPARRPFRRATSVRVPRPPK